MTSAELLRKGEVEQALAALQTEIRNKPEDVPLRIFLFQLNCVMGRLEKALTQLQVIASLNAETMLLAQIFRPVISCELLRREVFDGKRTALIFGEPLEWISMLVQANVLLAQCQYQAAAELRRQAFDMAPATAGKVNGQAFEWIADGDSRLGPVFEFIFDGKYYWAPVCRVQRVELEKPADLRDLVWLPVRVTWANGGAVSAHIPARYPGTEATENGALQLGRRTEWVEKDGETTLGLGQRLFVTDQGEHPLFDCQTIEIFAPI